MTDALQRPPRAATPLSAMVVADTDGVICFWSQGAQELTGHPAASAVGHSLDLIVPPEYRERHWTGFLAAMASGRTRFEGGAANIPVLCADGAVRCWPGRFTLIRDARGHPVGAAAVLVPPAADDPPLSSRPDLGARRGRHGA
jgi:PAS domain S-box-containing protein